MPFEFICFLLVNPFFANSKNITPHSYNFFPSSSVSNPFFGASKFDPKSELWTRITLFQGVPLPDKLSEQDSEEWAFPVIPALEVR